MGKKIANSFIFREAMVLKCYLAQMLAQGAKLLPHFVLKCHRSPAHEHVEGSSVCAQLKQQNCMHGDTIM